jgi:CBS domain-containing protein
MRTVADLLAHKGNDVHTIAADQTISEAAQMMVEHGVGSLVVTAGDELAGIVTRNDLVQALAERQSAVSACRVSEIMTAAVQTSHGAVELKELRANMVTRGIRHMPVSKDGAIVGVITLADILYLELHAANAMNEHLETYMYGPYF